MFNTNVISRSVNHLLRYESVVSGVGFLSFLGRKQHHNNNKINGSSTFLRCNFFSSIQFSLGTDSKSIESFENVGQPTALSHPYLMNPGELVPGTQISEFIERRCRLVEKIRLSKPGYSHIVIIPSAEVSYMTEKIPYIFRQNSDFQYLTGCLEPDSALLLSIKNNNFSSLLFLRESNKHSELWEGPRTGILKAPLMFAVDEAQPITSFSQVLKSLSQEANDGPVIWYDFFSPVQKNIHKVVMKHLTEGGEKELESPREIIHNLRLIKSKCEQRILKKSAEITSSAIQEAMAITRPGITEHQLFAKVDYECRMAGAERLAYPPVIATGNNANIIHYITNNQQTHDGQLVLVDAGCELHGYCSDITRTWPCNGKFSSIQKTLYDIVLSVQKDLIVKCSELPTLDSLFHDMCNLLGKRLAEAHVLKKEALNEKLDKVAFKLCPHHVSHYLGMDIHDTATVPRSINLREGMLITVEPGVYINHDNQLVHSEFRGCGIRIEDDVLISNSGPEVLSTCPKEISDLEQILNIVKNIKV